MDSGGAVPSGREHAVAIGSECHGRDDVLVTDSGADQFSGSDVPERRPHRANR